MRIVCKAPYISKDGIICPCGKCVSCLINKRKKWVLRMVIEAKAHQHNVFLTLTYKDMPDGGNLVPTHLEKYWKRLRKAGLKFRYFACGEYGGRFQRPHYHAILFGVSMKSEKLLSDCWGLGYIYLKEAKLEMMEYVAGYVTKKLSTQFRGDRVKEFCRMSRKPALGTLGLELVKHKFFLQSQEDVLSILAIDGRYFPLDKTMKRKMRELVFTDEEIEHIKHMNTLRLIRESRSLLREEFGHQWITFTEKNVVRLIGDAYERKYSEKQKIAQARWILKYEQKLQKEKL